MMEPEKQSIAHETAQHGVLVLASSQHATHPYAEWLTDLPVPLLALGDSSTPPSSTFTQVRLSSSWDPDVLLELAVTLHEKTGFDRVIGLGEVDIIPAARIRQALDLAGQHEDSAWVYRDKLKMREQAAAKGIPIPAFTAANTSLDVVEFMRMTNAPAMLKPRMGLGALGIRRVDDLAAAARLSFPANSGTYLVESFVDGPTFHVDILRVAEETVVAVPCAYIGAGCISHWDDGGIGSHTLSPRNPLADRLVAAASEVATAFKGPPDIAIHAEFFLSNDEILLCEVASRGGGGAIPLMLSKRLGADIRHLWTRIQAGLPVDWSGINHRLMSTPLVASFGLPPRDGQILELPGEAPPGVEDLQLRCSPGDDFAGSRYAQRHSGDFVAAWIVTADGEDELLRLVTTTAARMESSIIWAIAS